MATLLFVLATAVAYVQAGRELYSTTGNQAFLDAFQNSATCSAVNGDIAERYEEQECHRTPNAFRVNGVTTQYNSFTIDCGNGGEGFVYFQTNCAGSTSAQYSTPVCTSQVVGQPTQSYRFRCLAVKDNTPAPTYRPTTLRPTKKATPEPTKYPTTLFPTKKPTLAPTAKPSKLPTVKPTNRPTKQPTTKPTKLPTLTPTTKSPTVKPTPRFECAAYIDTTLQQCRNKLQKCSNLKAPMKWHARSCIDSKGNSMYDGGCQCKNYCGYTCKERCQEDPDCGWNPLNKPGERCVHWFYGHQPQKQTCQL